MQVDLRCQEIMYSQNYRELLADIKKKALEEIQREEFRKEVDAYKVKLRAAKWWHKLIPFTIRIERRK